jgi:hypothetical protein
LSEQSKEIRIKKRKLLLAEGKDAELFLVWACKKYRPQGDIQVLDFGGIKELGTFLKTLSQVEHFDEVETLVIARDSETDTQAAVTSMQTALRASNLPAPSGAFFYEIRDNFKTAIMVFPGSEFPKGTLEDLCLEIVKDDPIMPCVNDYLECLKRKQPTAKFTIPHKRKLHTFLAGKDKDFVGATIGQASYRNAWNPEHLALKPFKDIIVTM